MLNFYFIRHGETLSNTWHTLQGWSDTPLTNLGIQQGKNLGKGLREIPFLKIYSSTSERAYDTACYAKGEKDIDIIMYRGLKEMNFGLLETKSNTFKNCETYLERLFYPWDEVEGENMDMVCERMKHTIHQLVEENKHLDGNIMCVTHGISMLAAIQTVDNNVYEQCIRDETRFGNCCVSVIRWNQGIYQVLEVNNMEYVNKGGNVE